MKGKDLLKLQEQANIYQQHKAKIDSLKSGTLNLNTKSRKDEDGQLSIHQINDVFGLHDILTDGDIIPSPNDAARRLGGALGGVSGVVSSITGALGSPLFRRRYQRGAPFRDSQYPATIWTNGVNWDFNATLSEPNF
uniref:Adhesin n=1 Tax=Steinernema glaseri TaxID=37863 RepID=A0A1I7ZV52_9BILA